MKQTVEFARPEIEELFEFGKVRVQVILLPNEVLQNVGVIRHAVKDAGCCQPKPFELTAEVGAGHAGSLLIPRLRWCHYQRDLAIISSAKTVPNQPVSSKADEC